MGQKKKIWCQKKKLSNKSMRNSARKKKEKERRDSCGSAEDAEKGRNLG